MICPWYFVRIKISLYSIIPDHRVLSIFFFPFLPHYYSTSIPGSSSFFKKNFIDCIMQIAFYLLRCIEWKKKFLLFSWWQEKQSSGWKVEKSAMNIELMYLDLIVDGLNFSRACEKLRWIFINSSHAQCSVLWKLSRDVKIRFIKFICKNFNWILTNSLFDLIFIN